MGLTFAFRHPQILSALFSFYNPHGCWPYAAVGHLAVCGVVILCRFAQGLALLAVVPPRFDPLAGMGVGRLSLGVFVQAVHSWNFAYDPGGPTVRAFFGA